MTPSPEKKPSLVLRFVIMLVLVGLLLGGLVGFNLFKAKMIRQYMSGQSEPAATVSAVEISEQEWTDGIAAVGTLRALRAVDLSPEASGVVRRIGFVSGQNVGRGKLLVQLNDDAEQAQLRSLEVARDLAQTTLQRDRRLLALQAVTEAQVEADDADLRNKTAQVEAERALLARKVLLAPFAGRIGISTVAPGQYVNPGDKLANLQDLDHLVVDFSVPQSLAPQALLHAAVDLTVDAYPDEHFRGEVSARNAQVDSSTRNLQVEATLPNPRHRLLPGMFAHVNLLAKGSRRLPTLPQSAVAFNPYGAVVFLVQEDKDAQGKAVLHAKQVIVKTGPTRGDQVAILEGIPPHSRVVTSGQLKLRNGTPIVIDNTVAPVADPDPHPADR